MYQPDSDLDTIKEMIEGILQNKTETISFYQLYSKIYDLVTRGYGNKQYNVICTILKRHTKEQSNFVETLREETFLSVMNQKWKQHIKLLITLSDIFKTLHDRVIVVQEWLSLKERGKKYWIKYVLRGIKTPQNAILKKMIELIMNQISKERKGDHINRKLLGNVIQMLIELDETKKFYQTNFEKVFLLDSEIYFENKSNELISNHSCGGLIYKTEAKIDPVRITIYKRRFKLIQKLKILHYDELINYLPFREKEFENINWQSNNLKELEIELDKFRINQLENSPSWKVQKYLKIIQINNTINKQQRYLKWKGSTSILKLRNFTNYLNRYSYVMNKNKSKYCEICKKINNLDIIEDLDHFLWNCSAYENNHKIWISELKKINISNILKNNNIENIIIKKIHQVY
ncbi:cullin-3a-related [Anaeramoeba flamelloides]|uniref:Cullin-3a-related n=1 Tax=Anaeramoeba flamelloides TaxID=1746091 RepID=A0AAV7ZKS2_9EUKA|nr:cullin-3a-related [Anaeramoeba flamelloides]